MNNVNEIAEAAESDTQLMMDTDLAECDYKMILAGGVHQEEGIVEEESEDNLHKVLNSCFSRSHFEIGGLATARTELGVSIYLGHMLAEDVWVGHFCGTEIEAIIHDFEEPQVQEEWCHQCWGWSTELHEKGLLLRLDGSRSELATFQKVCTPCLHCRKAGKAKGH